MSLDSILIRYSTFAILAIICNLLTQRTILLFGDSVYLFSLAVALGTIVGLVIKFVLDKNWIFKQLAYTSRPNSQQFILYSATGVLTTVVFWGMETLFWLVFSNDFMREAGAIIGLTVGYIMKYQLDRRYVFNDMSIEGHR